MVWVIEFQGQALRRLDCKCGVAKLAAYTAGDEHKPAPCPDCGSETETKMRPEAA